MVLQQSIMVVVKTANFRSGAEDPAETLRAAFY